MAITRKPKKTANKSQFEVEALINKGGSIAKFTQNTSFDKAATEKQVTLRIPVFMLTEIDNSLKQNAIRIPRHTWILKAIVEKLKREKADNK